MRRPLTKRQREVFNFIEGFIREHAYSPSFQEIAEHFQFKSLSTVHEHIQTLQAKGYLRRSFNSARAIELVDPDTVWQPVPGGEFVIPAEARFVPVAALPQLFHAWLQKRQMPDPPGFASC